MVFERIEKLKQQYTDKFVVVDENRPELRRFKGLTGTVRTVNMSGRALVEFDGNNNIGWFDIELSFLKVIDAPLPKVEKAKAAPEKSTKPAAEKPTPPAGKQPASKMSVAEMLAASRGGAKPATASEKPAAEAKAAAKPAAAKMSVADMLAAARGKDTGGGTASSAAPTVDAKSKTAPTKASPAKTDSPKAAAKDPKQMSVTEMLAAARGEKSGSATAPVSQPKAEKTSESVVPAQEPATADEPDVETPNAAADAPASGGSGSQRGVISDVAGMVAYCRKVDT